MSDERDLSNIFSPDLYHNSFQDGAKSLMDLPLNLLALIIGYVGRPSILEMSSADAMSSLKTPKILPISLERAECFITCHYHNCTLESP